MMNTEILQASGNLEIVKIYSNGTEELVFSDHNIITSGFGVNLGLMFAGSGSDNVRDHQIRWFIIGSGTNNPVTANINSLSANSPMPENVPFTLRYLTDSTGGLLGSQVSMCPIPNSSIKRTGKTSVTYYLLLPNRESNGASQEISEVGLCVDKPYKKFGITDRTLLVAYRTFPTISKTNDFSLLFKWTISV